MRMSKQQRLDEAVYGLTRFRSEVGLSQYDSKPLKKQGLKAGEKFLARGFTWKVNRYAEGQFWVQRVH